MIYTITLNPSIDYIMRVNNLTIGKTNRSIEEYKFPGGKGINVSRILHRLDIPSIVLGFLGGFTGAFIQNVLENEGISCDFTKIKEDNRINVKLKEQTESEINASGPQISEEEQALFLDKIAQLSKQDFVVLSGSLPSSLSPDFYQEVIRQLHKQEVSFVLDTTGKQLLDNLVFQPFLIKPNKDELEELIDAQLETLEEITSAATVLLERGAQNVLVSLGAEGAVLVHPTGTIHLPAPKGIVKNSVGAGDSMVAGFIGAYTQEANLKSALKLGIACGSATAFSDDLACKEDIMKIMKQLG